jgi:hypothetical protein
VSGAPAGSAAETARPTVCEPSVLASPYVPVDSWVYPAVLRLYSLGFVDSVFIGMRPYTRASIDHMLDEAGARIEDADPGSATDEAEGIYESLTHELRADVEGPCGGLKGVTRLESVYSAERVISGTPLRDSYHLGSTVVNDYGRPYENGFNDYSGASGYASAGRFLIYARGEFQGAQSGVGYSAGLSHSLAVVDDLENFFNPDCYLHGTTCVPLPLNQISTIPFGPIPTATNGRLLEAYASAHFFNHDFSFGKQDEWLGPGLGGAMAYSNNAENIYSFRVNRIEPLRIPLLSRITGPFRYEFLVGPTRGNIYPKNPWVHVEKISLKPTENLEFGFERTVVWGGKGHEAITLDSFFRSFFSTVNVTGQVKDSNKDPGARFGAFNFSWRLPFVRKWLTLYTDSEAHDDVSPIDAPRRAAYRPGLYLSHVPGIPKLDMRVEGFSTDPPTTRSIGGKFMYWEIMQRQAYANKGSLFGDWAGREDKGGQAWLTYHLSGNEWIQASYRNQKAAKDFIPGGTTLNDVSVQAVKRIGKDIEINGNFAFEHWNAPIYPTGVPTYPNAQHTVTTTTIQVTWFPKDRKSF